MSETWKCDSCGWSGDSPRIGSSWYHCPECDGPVKSDCLDIPNPLGGKPRQEIAELRAEVERLKAENASFYRVIRHAFPNIERELLAAIIDAKVKKGSKN